MNKKHLFLLFVLIQLTLQQDKKPLKDLYNNEIGKIGSYSYELWKDYGSTRMGLFGEGLFDCWWQDIGNALFRIGKKWDCTKNWDQLGTIKVNYGVYYKPEGNSYLCVYGWTKDPLIEYYIVDSWGNWRPPGTSSKGTITVDGGVYDIYTSDRIQQPSIIGTTTFKQFWSVRKDKRDSGTISVSEHFKAWTSKGMRLGKMYEASLTVEGYRSNGYANVWQNDIYGG